VAAMPDIITDRTDVVTVGWDNITTSYQTVIEYVFFFLVAQSLHMCMFHYSLFKIPQAKAAM
jgi:hypothetical protein